MGIRFSKLKENGSRAVLQSGPSGSDNVSSQEGVSSTENLTSGVIPPNTQERLSRSSSGFGPQEIGEEDSSGEASSVHSDSIDERLFTYARLSSDIPLNGITGCDLTQPPFDGTSTNNDDYFIEIEDDSMETTPDVRPYFWRLGQWQRRHTELDIPKDRVNYDNELVREGRELLKSARREGRGYFLNEKRYLLDHNNPGDIWYRMPAVRVVQAVVYGERAYGESALPAQEDEGTFYVREGGLDDFAGVILLTNIRAPSIFARYERFPPGTAPWDAGIFQYYSLNHFVFAAYVSRLEPWEIVHGQKLDEYTSVDFEAMQAMLHEHWPTPPPSPETPPFEDKGSHEGGWGKKWLPYSS